MKWSKYQTAIFDSNINCDRNKFVKATAGSGKTTVIEKCINDAPQDRQILAIAFGVAIKDELVKRLGHLPNVTVKTFNGFGYAGCREAVKKYIKIDKKKVENLLYFDVMKKPKEKSEKDLYYGARGIVCKLIGLLKANMEWEPTLSDVVGLLELHGIDLPKGISQDQVFSLVEQTWKLNWLKTTVMDFDDQVAMPLFHNWPLPTYEWTYTDEAQDLTPAQIELSYRATEKRAYFVGDPRQAIYLFRGADSNAVDNIITRMSCDVMPLSVCYRCSKAVVRRAQQKAPEIEYHEGAVEGSDSEVTTAEFRQQVQDGDFVLCRTTAPLVSECLRLIRQGRKATVRGREIGQNLIEFIDAIGYQGRDFEGFREALTMYWGDQSEKLKQAGKDDALILLTDKYETIICLLQAVRSLTEMKGLISEIFDNDATEGVQLMTIHKSKGLEADTVWILRPDQLPHKLSKTAEALKAEDNLWFVAVTRCRIDLRWVTPEKREEYA